MPFKIIRDDITNVKADAIVNTANPHPTYASGTDAAIYKAAGAEELIKERQKIGEIKRGQVAVTPAFALQADYIIHTVGPVWTDGEHREFDILTGCYENSLAKAAELKCRSIAFPLIATGVYGFPKDRALQIAVSVISRFLMKQDIQVILVVFDRCSFELSGKLFQDVDSFIDENYVAKLKSEEYREGTSTRRLDAEEERVRSSRRREEQKILADEIIQPADADYAPMQSASCPPIRPIPLPSEGLSADSDINQDDISLEEVLGNIGETFQQRLLHLIDERGLSDVEVYKRANLDRKLFSKIRCNEDYRPKKKTALALAIALELNIDETEDLLKRAGLALSQSNLSDLIIRYFINRQEYDIYSINLSLFEHEQPILGE
ncbi:MAG: macro domain-containing protein [Clostridiales bacterium]|nr:macro domain-containing protein [Clostridiales bacterium]